MEVSTAVLTKILYQFIAMSALLVTGAFLRAKVKLFQNLYLPASVIGGFIGLILGPVVLGKAAVIPFPQDWINDFAKYPGVLIIPIITAAPLGITIPRWREFTESVGPHFIVATGIVFLQLALGAAIGALFMGVIPGLYPTFGLELFAGFWGGHATAGLLGNMLKNAGLEYWQVSQGVAVTVATVGIVGGIVIGMALINWAARRNYTGVLTKPADIPEEIKAGYYRDPKRQESVGRMTILPESMDVMAFHMSLILVVLGAAYIVLGFFKAHKVPVLMDLSVWLWGLLLMLIVWIILDRRGYGWMVDRKLVNRVTSLLMEYAVVAAIISIPIRAVLGYILPMMVFMVLGMIATIAWCVHPIGSRLLPNPWLERGIATFGQSTGVFMTGLLLLRVSDPQFVTPALTSFSLSFALSSLFAWPYFALAPKIILGRGPLAFAGISFVLFLVTWAVGMLVGWRYPHPARRVQVRD